MFTVSSALSVLFDVCARREGAGAVRSLCLAAAVRVERALHGALPGALPPSPSLEEEFAFLWGQLDRF